jgi:hypothetical protein
VTCVVISGRTHAQSATIEFLEAFGETFLARRGE